jgi:hypothetical protein
MVMIAIRGAMDGVFKKIEDVVDCSEVYRPTTPLDKYVLFFRT